jgi:hypothetical protein
MQGIFVEYGDQRTVVMKSFTGLCLMGKDLEGNCRGLIECCIGTCAETLRDIAITSVRTVGVQQSFEPGTSQI